MPHYLPSVRTFVNFAGAPEWAKDKIDLCFRSEAKQGREDIIAVRYALVCTMVVPSKKADDLRHVVTRVPLDRLLIETDGPFLTPHPYRGKRNEPAYVQYVADRIAGLHTTTLEAVARQTSANAIRLFNLPLEAPA